MQPEIIDQIRAAHREHCFMMEQRKRSDLALGSFLRMMLGWSKDLPKDESDKIKADAARMIKTGEAGEWSPVVSAARQAAKPFEAVEKAALKRMKSLAESLPVWAEFGEPIRGFGAASLAVILAEAGDLSGYDSKSKLWKRMGLAPGQGSVPKGLTPEKRKEAWIERGYNPRRRSHMWNIGDTLMKGQVRKIKDGAGEDTGERMSLGVYGRVYLDRKAYELARDPDIHAHRRAQRYMEKRLLRDLWQAWRRSSPKVIERSGDALTAPEFRKAA